VLWLPRWYATGLCCHTSGLETQQHRRILLLGGSDGVRRCWSWSYFDGMNFIDKELMQCRVSFAVSLSPRKT